MKKVLVISYYWPPSGGISVLRSLKIVKYLREYGWEPIVYAPSNAHYPYLDANNEIDIPDNLTVIKKPIIEPFVVFKWLTGRKKEEPLNNIVTVRTKKPSMLDHISIWVRGNFFIPDARSLWIRPSVKFLTTYLKENPVDAIFTDGPPHTNTYIGYLLSKNLNIPWLMDFQDPWTQVDYYQLLKIGKRADAQHKKMESQCLHQASKTTIASPTWKNDLEAIGAKNVDVIYYGFDESDFNNLKKEPSDNNPYFTIAHTGLLGSDRNPASLIEALETMQTSKPIRLLLAGQVDSEVLKELHSKAKNIIIEYVGTVSRVNSLQIILHADLLLLPLNQATNAKGRLPGKLYEYLRSYNPILALGPTDSDAAHILQKTNTGICVEYGDQGKQVKFVSGLLEKNHTFKPDVASIQFFSNQNQTRLIAQYLDEII